MHTAKFLKNTKKSYLIKKNKIHGMFYFLAYILNLVTSLLNLWKFNQYFNNLYDFNSWELMVNILV
jgi:hypothetical protein